MGILEFWTSQTKQHWGGVLRCLSKSALAFGFVFLVLYLWFVPAVINKVEADFQYKMTYYRHPEEHWDNIRKAIARVKADPVKMAKIRQQVTAETAARKAAANGEPDR